MCRSWERRRGPGLYHPRGRWGVVVLRGDQDFLPEDAEFRGRASRPEFWWFALLYYLVILAPIAPLIAIGSVGRGDQPWDEADMNVAGVVFGIVIGMAVLALIIPYLAVGTRRLHDTGKPGWR